MNAPECNNREIWRNMGANGNKWVAAHKFVRENLHLGISFSSETLRTINFVRIYRWQKLWTKQSDTAHFSQSMNTLIRLHALIIRWQKKRHIMDVFH